MPALDMDFINAALSRIATTHAKTTSSETISAIDNPELTPSEIHLESLLRRAERLINRYDMRAALDQIMDILNNDNITLDSGTLDLIHDLAEIAIQNLSAAGYRAEAKRLAKMISPAVEPEDENTFALTLAA